ncbi:cobalamin-binding protein [Microbacteriaceae bacterium 4G12]
MSELRVVSLCPSNTELMAYLGCIDLLVGVDDYSDWPAYIHHLPRLGPDLNINMDMVESLQPDLILASLSVPGMEKNIVQLQQRKLPYIVLNPNSLQDIASDLLTLGKAIHMSDQAEQLVDKYYAFIKQYEQLSQTVTHTPSLYWEWWPKPVFTPGKTNWLTEISKLAGGMNVFSHIEQANVQSDWETVKDINPDHICLAWVGVQTSKVNPTIVLKRLGWKGINAVKRNNIHVLEEWLYCRPSPRLLLGLKKLAPLIHPDVFPHFDGDDPLLEP